MCSGCTQKGGSPVFEKGVFEAICGNPGWKVDPALAGMDVLLVLHQKLAVG